jgi:hypothetical protein
MSHTTFCGLIGLFLACCSFPSYGANFPLLFPFDDFERLDCIERDPQIEKMVANLLERQNFLYHCFYMAPILLNPDYEVRSGLWKLYTGDADWLYTLFSDKDIKRSLNEAPERFVRMQREILCRRVDFAKGEGLSCAARLLILARSTYDDRPGKEKPCDIAAIKMARQFVIAVEMLSR